MTHASHITITGLETHELQFTSEAQFLSWARDYCERACTSDNSIDEAKNVLAAIYNRQPGGVWTGGEEQALYRVWNGGRGYNEIMTMAPRYSWFRKERAQKKQRDGSAENPQARASLELLLNNWPGEIAKMEEWELATGVKKPEKKEALRPSDWQEKVFKRWEVEHGSIG